jgi:deoxyribodipyrimidine photolyase
MERFDPRGAYVRRYVPELRGVPLEYLAEPWTMPAEVQEASGCVIGRDYPEPIVDRREARQEALARYRT